MEKLLFVNARLLLPYRILDGWLAVRDGLIADLGQGSPETTDGCRVIDCGGRFLSPGFIELHTHGCGGHDYMDGTAEAYLACAAELARHGVTLVYPTVTTGSDADFSASLAAYDEAARRNEGTPFGGLHLEGPYFAYAMRGAQDPRFLRNPDPAEYLPILERAPQIKRWSVAPELPGAPALGRELRRRGILAAMGHTDGVTEELMTAYENGYTHMTHFYSAMSTVRRINAFRHSGAVELGYMVDEITVEIIADGVHLPPELLRQVFRFKPHDKISLITDSMRGAGMPEGSTVTLGSIRDGQPVVIEDGVAKLLDRSAFAGSVATEERLLRVVTREAGVELGDAVRMLTANPAAVMGLTERKGSLRIGKDADLTLFDDDITIAMTVAGGKMIYVRQ